MQCCRFSADVATRMLPATDLRLLIGILLPGQPKQQVLGVTSPHFFSSAQVYCCKKAFSASTGLLSNRVLPGGLHLTATHRKETKYRKKIKLLLEEERLLLFLRSSVGSAWVLLPAGPG